MENQNWYENLSKQQLEYWFESRVNPKSVCNKCKDVLNCSLYDDYNILEHPLIVIFCKSFKRDDKK